MPIKNLNIIAFVLSCLASTTISAKNLHETAFNCVVVDSNQTVINEGRKLKKNYAWDKPARNERFEIKLWYDNLLRPSLNISTKPGLYTFLSFFKEDIVSADGDRKGITFYSPDKYHSDTNTYSPGSTMIFTDSVIRTLTFDQEIWLMRYFRSDWHGLIIRRAENWGSGYGDSELGTTTISISCQERDDMANFIKSITPLFKKPN